MLARIASPNRRKRFAGPVSLATLTLLAGILSPAWSVHAAGLDGLVANTAAAEIYGGDHLEGLGTKSELVYAYRLEGKLMEKPFDDSVILDFSRTDANGENPGFTVAATLFAKTGAQHIGPITSSTFNPLLLIFFQRDVNQMSRGTGGSGNYFRNVIRHAMGVPGHFTEESVTIEIDGKPAEARQISFQPFVTDANRERMKSFAAKTYTITLSDAVPGTIYELATLTPAEDGGAPMLRESYRFQEQR